MTRRGLLLDRSVGIREAGSGELLALLGASGSGGDVGVTTGGSLRVVLFLRLSPRLVTIHRK